MGVLPWPPLLRRSRALPWISSKTHPVQFQGDPEDALPELITLQPGEEVLLAKEMTLVRPWTLLRDAYVWVTSARLVLLKGHDLTVLPGRLIDDVRIQWTDTSLVTIRYRNAAHEKVRLSLRAGGQQTWKEGRNQLLQVLRKCCANRALTISTDSKVDDAVGKLRRPVATIMLLVVQCLAIIGLIWSVNDYRVGNRGMQMYSGSPDCRAGLQATPAPTAPCRVMHLRVNRKSILSSGRSSRFELELVGPKALQQAIVTNRDFYNAAHLGDTLAVQVFRNQVTIVANGDWVLRTPLYPDYQLGYEAWWIAICALWTVLPIWCLWQLRRKNAASSNW